MPRTGLKVSVVVVQSNFQVQPNFIVVKLGRVDVVVGVVTIIPGILERT